MLARLRLAIAWWLRRPAWLRWLAVAAAVATIWWSSAQSPVQSQPSTWRAFLHNGAHVIAFGGIAGFALLAMGGQADRGRRLRAVAFTAVYGAIDEWHQAFVPGRVSSVGDWFTDVAGACLACAVLVAIDLPTRQNWRAVVAGSGLALLCICAATWLPI